MERFSLIENNVDNTRSTFKQIYNARERSQENLASCIPEEWCLLRNSLKQFLQEGSVRGLCHHHRWYVIGPEHLPVGQEVEVKTSGFHDPDLVQD
jgi:hypothetical protein